MESRLPVPTDNIFKFYALFSLLVLVFSISAVLYTNKTANDRVFANLVEIETLKQDPVPTPSQKMRLAALERQLEVSQSNRKFFLWALSILTALSGAGIYYGFRKWHMEVQPVIDESSRVQLEIAKLQLMKLRRELESGEPNTSIGRTSYRRLRRR